MLPLKKFNMNKEVLVKFKEGDRVRVVKNNSDSDEFVGLSIGVEAKILAIWEGEQYPIELDGFGEHVTEDEIELVV